MELEKFEFEGKTKEEAIEKACKELNVSREELEVEVIESGSSGIFGIVGGRKSKIRVRIKDDHNPFQDGFSFAKEALENILRLFNIEGLSIDGEMVDGNIILRIEGDDSGILIGKGGRTLDALEFIINKIVNKRLKERLQIVIDSQNYRERKKEYLKKLAIDMGNRAKRLGRAVSTDLLSPRDRRIIHITLKDDKALETKSTGEGHLRKVIIIPRSRDKNSRGEPKGKRYEK